MQNLMNVLEHLGEEETLDAVDIEWNESQVDMPAETLEFLTPEQVESNLDYCGFSRDVFERVQLAANRIRSDAALTALAWHCYWRLYRSGDPTMHWFTGWPKLKHSLGSDAGLFILLVGIAMAPLVREHHRKMGIPDEVTRETCLEPYTYSLNYKEAYGGELGLIWSQLFWLRHYPREKYFRLGRLEFWLKPMGLDLRAYRNQQSGQVTALAVDGVRFDAQGFRPGDTEGDLPGQWRAQFITQNGQVTGNIVHPDGYAIREPVSLNMSEWQLILEPVDWVLDMHIPAGGGMTPAAVHSSLRRAAEFFSYHFPATPPKAYICSSWIYNPALAEILPHESNLALNLKDAYLIPIPSDPRDGLGFMFYQDQFDPQTAPRKTSLQRAILDYLAQGSRWRCGGMFYLLDDLDKLGTGFYQSAEFFNPHRVCPLE